MTKDVLLIVLGVALGWASHTKVAAAWARGVSKKIRVVAYRELHHAPKTPPTGGG